MIANYGWLILLVLCLLPWIGPWRGRDSVQNLLRTLVFAMLALALANPYLQRDNAPAYRALIVDQTASVSEDARQRSIDRAVQFAGAGTKSRSHLIVMGSLDDSDTRRLEEHFASVSSIATNGPEGTTPFSAAISRAAALIPRSSNGSVSIASDGMTTRPDDARAIASLRRRGIPVHVIELPRADVGPTPVAINWQDSLRVGATSRLSAVVASSLPGTSGRVVLRAKGKELASAPYQGGAREEVGLTFEPTESGFIEAELVVITSGEEKVLDVVLPVRKPIQVMYLGGLQQNGATELSKALGNGFRVGDIDPNDSDKFNQALSETDLVMLDDRPAQGMPKPAEERLVDAVTNEGLGMVMSGGRGSFGSGGWHDRPVESILPVELVQKEEKRDPSTTLVIVIDTSGSMTGVRVQLAKEVARLAMRRLLPHDKVGIVEFYGAKRWAAPIQPASNAIELQRALNRMDAGGGTVILPALEEAFYGLQNVDTRYKHVLVLTDGGVESGNFESLMRRMSNEGINVSTVLAGGGYHSEFLVNIANWGKGRFYNVPNRFNLPEILLKQPSTAKLPAYRPGTHLVRARGGSGWWGDVDVKSVPQLAGYIETKARPGSTVLMETVEGQHPVLATWRYGLGRVTTMATEPVGEGTRPWRNWNGYGKTLARILERSAADTRDPFRYEVEHDGYELVLHAIRQRPRTGQDGDSLPRATLVRADGEATENDELKFVARSPDRYVASYPAAAAGETLRIEASSTTFPERRIPLVAPSPVANELQVDPRQAVHLEELAAATKGETLDYTGSWATTTEASGGHQLISLAPWFFGAMLILFLAEIIWRRRPNRQDNLQTVIQ